MGRGVSQVFTFILALFVVGAIALLMTFIFSKVWINRESAEFMHLEDSMVSQFKTLSYGSTKTIRVSVPSKVTKVCFYDSTHTNEKEENPEAWDFNSAFLSELAGQGYNVFLVHKKTLVRYMKLRGIRLTSKFVMCCNSATGVLKLNAEGGEYGTTIVYCG